MADLTFGGVDIHNLTTGIYLDIVSGFDGVAEVRGTDITIPGRPGRTPLSRLKHRRLIELRGYVFGMSAQAEQAYRANIVTLQALIDPDDAAKALVATAPYLGLVSGSKTISARFLDAIWGTVVDGVSCEVSVQLEAVGNPPDWA